MQVLPVQNNNYGTPSFNGYLDKSVYKFVERARKAELQAFYENNKGLPTDKFETGLERIKANWDKAVSELLHNAEHLDSDTEIKVVKCENIAYDTFGGSRKIQCDYLSATNHKVSETLYLTKLSNIEQYVSGYKYAKDFLSSINLQRTDIQLFNSNKRRLLKMDTVIPDSFVEDLSIFGEKIGKKLSKHFLKRVARHNNKFVKQNNIERDNNKLFFDFISKL